MNSVELLEHAAEVLRLRADRLPEEPRDHPWFIVQGDSESMDVVAACCEHTEDEATACDGCYLIETRHEHAAEFIQLMHPPVALALADWLEATAAELGGPLPSYLDDVDKAAVAVAIAILRKEQT